MKRNFKLGVVLAVLAVLLFTQGCGKQDGGSDDPNASQSQSAVEGGGLRPQVPDRKNELLAAEKKNSDVVAWLQVPNTQIDEAVVQTDNNEYYLRRNVEKKYAYEGCYYMDYESLLFHDGKDLSQNTIIYGHNLGSPLGVRDDPNGAKFAQLLKLNDKETAEGIPYIYLTTNGETHIFEIFAAFYCESLTSPVPYHYAEYPEERLTALAKDAKARSEFIYDVKVNGDDKIITLSTCTYKFGTYSQNPDQRYVVMGRMMREGDTFHERARIEKNPSPKQPNFQT